MNSKSERSSKSTLQCGPTPSPTHSFSGKLEDRPADEGRHHQPQVRSEQNDIPIHLELSALEDGYVLSDSLQAAGIQLPVDDPRLPNKQIDYLSPYSWPTLKKLIVLSGPFMASTLAAYSVGSYALAWQLRQEWHISDIEFNIGITLFVAGFGFSPMILAPVSEEYGRYWVFVGSGIVFFCGTLGCALVDSYPAMLCSRFITGCGAAVFATLTGGVVGDLYHKEQRNTPMALYSLSIMIGTGLGPLFSGVVVDRLGWRWIFRVQLIAIGVTTAFIALLFQETRSNVLLRRMSKSLNERKGNLPVVFIVDPVAPFNIVTVCRSFGFPLRLLVTESVVFWFSLWVSFAWAILYMQFTSIDFVFRGVYGFDNTRVGIVYSAVVLASGLGAIVAIYQDRLISALPFGKHNSSNMNPEARLLPSCFLSVLLPVGLLWFGWSAKPDVSWLVPAAAIGSCTVGIFSIYLAVFNYFVDTYHQYSSSALAAQSLCRNLAAGIFPLITSSMMRKLSIKGAGSLLGGLGLVLTCIPWLLFVFGKRIRFRSRLASQT